MRTFKGRILPITSQRLLSRMSQRLLSIILTLILVLSTAGCAGAPRRGEADTSAFGRDDTSVAGGIQDYSGITVPPGTWAIYWYLCGSDLESDGGYATTDLQEMLEVVLPDNVTVVIETGGAEDWQNDVMSADALERYVYRSDTLEQVDVVSNASMGNPNTFAEFLGYCNRNYPAEKQFVIIWNHGGGSLGGAAFDRNFDDDSLSLPELKDAFVAAPAISGSYEIVGFDACLMATIDMVDVLNGRAHYLLAAEESEPACGWDYAGLFSALAQSPTQDGAELGRAVCDSFYSGCTDYGVEDEATLSVVDLSKADKLLAAYNGIGDEALISGAAQGESYFSALSGAALDSEIYGGGNFDMVDLGDLVEHAGTSLLPRGGSAMLAALDEALVYQVKGPLRSEATGLACYHSYDGSPDVLQMFTDIGSNKGFGYYYEYALTGSLSQAGQDYLARAQSEAGTTQTEAQTLEPVQPGGLDGAKLTVGSNGHYTLNIGAEQAKSIAGAYLSVQYCSYYDGRPSYAFDLGTSRAVDVSKLSEGVIADSFGGKWTVARNAGYDAYTEIYLEVADRSPGEYTIYACPVMLSNAQNTAAGTEAVLMASYDEKTKQYSILGVRSTDTGTEIIASSTGGDGGASGGGGSGTGNSSGNGSGSGSGNVISNGAGNVITNNNSIISNGKMRMASKDLRPLAEGDILQPIWRWANADENGTVPTLEWDKPGSEEFDYRFMLDKSTEFYDQAFLDGYYRVSFVMIDYTGQPHVSDAGWYQYDEGTDTVKAVAASGMPTIR